ncbi:CPBP family glutamic-type intramembrane protease [Pleurocapsa sp. FMAR1]|uniref:CPBP family glutamic-type intramembrane protease n=1 Tax=Pleurocapsa sp. FMAR1 TaxID=3040204 RepID=UPI0029C7ACA5|nr:CPBP family glutamic-type intramembrane protease [Pleurocapsa sp. FMAR1]
MFDTSWLNVVTFFGAWAILWLPIAFIISRLINWQPNQPLIPRQKIILLLSLYAFVPLILGWKIKAENLLLADLGLSLDSYILASILLGLILSVISLAIVFSFESAFKFVSWHRENIKSLLPLLLPILILSLLISLSEELVFRGYVYSTLSTNGSYWLAATFSSLIFALLHLLWERRATAPQIPGLWLMGMILVEARLINNHDIYLAVGLHAGWIWGLTCIDSAQLLTYSYKNHWLTGINQQPLAGVAGILCLTVTGWALWLISSKLVLF